jgi:hypothetical protein
MSGFDHLGVEARTALNLPLEERIAYALDDHWIGYSRAQQTLDTLSDLMNHPPTLRMPNLLVVGESGNGKSTVIAQRDSLLDRTSPGTQHRPS